MMIRRPGSRRRLVVLSCIGLVLALLIGLGWVAPLPVKAALPQENGAAFLFADNLDFSDGKMYYDPLPPAGGDVALYSIAAKWNKNPVTYSLENCPRSLECGAAHQATREAIEAWDAVSGLQLDEVGSNGDIRIAWYAGAHGDGNPFDGPGGILGHAFFPVPQLGDLAGDIHLDDDETWVVHAPTHPYEVHLKTVVMHEAGHALGLDHSDDPAALMWAEYDGGTKGLGADDIAGIQALYGPPDGDAPVLPAGPANVTATPTTTLRVRSGPGTEWRQVGSIPAGATVPVLGRNDSGLWIFVEYEGVRGWAAAWLCIINGDLNTVPVVNDDGSGAVPPAEPPAQPPGNPPPGPSGVMAMATSMLRIRSGPGTEWDQIGSLPAGVAVPVLGRNASSYWILIDYQGLQGWVAAWLCVFNGDLETVPVLLIEGLGELNDAEGGAGQVVFVQKMAA